MPNLKKSTISVALIALGQARHGETSVTAQLRIAAAIKDLEQALASYDQPVRNIDFTVEELFTDGGPLTRTSCQECGAQVYAPEYERHVSWHNKLLP